MFGQSIVYQVQLTATIQNQYTGESIQAYQCELLSNRRVAITVSEQRLNPEENELIFKQIFVL